MDSQGIGRVGQQTSSYRVSSLTSPNSRKNAKCTSITRSKILNKRRSLPLHFYQIIQFLLFTSFDKILICSLQSSKKAAPQNASSVISTATSNGRNHRKSIGYLGYCHPKLLTSNSVKKSCSLFPFTIMQQEIAALLNDTARTAATIMGLLSIQQTGNSQKINRPGESDNLTIRPPGRPPRKTFIQMESCRTLLIWAR